MLEIISGRELFNPGCGQKFQEKAGQMSLSSRVEDILGKAGVIRKSHIDGHPNNSHTASAEGASNAAHCLLAGKRKKFIRNNDKWFGQNAQETWNSLKKLF